MHYYISICPNAIHIFINGEPCGQLFRRTLDISNGNFISSLLSLSLAVYISFSLPLCLTRDQFNKLYRKYWLLNTLEQITGLCKKRGRRKMMVENYKLICIFIIVTLGWLAIYVNNKKKNEKKFARKNKIRSRYVWGTIYKCSRVFLHSQLSLWILIYLCILFAAYTFACVWQKAEVSALFVLAHGQQ